MPNSGDTGNGTAKSVRALDFAAGHLFASWGESVNKTVIYDQASAAFLRFWVTDGDTQAILTDCGNAYLGGHWFRYAGANNSAAATYFAAFDATTFNKEAVVAPIPPTARWGSSASSPTARPASGSVVTSTAAGATRPHG